MSEKIKVISAVNGRCVINNRDMGIKRQWPGRGSSIVFTKEQIEQLMYDNAFSNMIREGYLYIEDMDVKKEIGLEPEDATNPSIILMDDNEFELPRLMGSHKSKYLPISQVKVAKIQGNGEHMIDWVKRFHLTYGIGKKHTTLISTEKYVITLLHD